MIENTEILVVIGYSFPFFNKQVDEQLISFCSSSLRSVYFQDPISDGQFLKNRFKELKQKKGFSIGKFNYTIPIIPVNDVEQYHVPFEFKH